MLLTTRWNLARLRHERLFSLAALNARIAERLEDLNTRPMQLYRASGATSSSAWIARRSDPCRPSPSPPGDWKLDARVNIELPRRAGRALQLGPLRPSSTLVDARRTATTVECQPSPHSAPPGRASGAVQACLRWTHRTEEVPFLSRVFQLSRLAFEDSLQKRLRQLFRKCPCLRLLRPPRDFPSWVVRSVYPARLRYIPGWFGGFPRPIPVLTSFLPTGCGR